MKSFSNLLKIIKSRSATVGVVGMGYVGTALTEGILIGNYKVIGFDINQNRVAEINGQLNPNLSATSDMSGISEVDIICVCIPTPLDKNNKPDYSILKDVTLVVSKHIKAGQLVVIESSVAPGITRNFIAPILSKSKLKIGIDLFIAYSPERVDPGNDKYSVNNTPKIVSGYDEKSLKLAKLFYESFVEKVYPVSSCETAEMTKVLENTFRLVNISLINEVNQFTKGAGIDIWEVIKAASTKPFGFMAHYPGPGAGGDCIPVLPYHLLDAAKKKKISLKVVEAAAKVNELQPRKIANKAIELANGKLANGHKLNVLLVGVAYKEETADIRQSPALKIWKTLSESGLNVSYHDPYVDRVNGSQSRKMTKSTVSEQDLIIITTAHKKIPYGMLVKANKPVIDTKNILSKYRRPHIIKV